MGAEVPTERILCLTRFGSGLGGPEESLTAAFLMILGHVTLPVGPRFEVATARPHGQIRV